MVVRVDGRVVASVRLERRSFTRRRRAAARRVDGPGRDRSTRAGGGSAGPVATSSACPVPLGRGSAPASLDPRLQRRRAAARRGVPGDGGGVRREPRHRSRGRVERARDVPGGVDPEARDRGHAAGTRRAAPPAPGSTLDRLMRRMLDPVGQRGGERRRSCCSAARPAAAGSSSTRDALDRARADRDVRRLHHRHARSTADPRARGARRAADVVEQPSWGIGKATTALRPRRLYRGVWLASGGLGPLAARPGLTPAEARYLLYVLAQSAPGSKLGRGGHGRPEWSSSTRPAGSTRARHDAGLVVWRGGVFVAAVMTYRAGRGRRRTCSPAGRRGGARRFRG